MERRGGAALPAQGRGNSHEQYDLWITIMCIIWVVLVDRLLMFKMAKHCRTFCTLHKGIHDGNYSETLHNFNAELGLFVENDNGIFNWLVSNHVNQNEHAGSHF